MSGRDRLGRHEFPTLGASRRLCAPRAALAAVALVLSMLWLSGTVAAGPPQSPAAVGPGARPAIVFLHAPWCQWCKVLEAEVLPAPEVRAVLRRRYRVFDVDVDRFPEWMDLPGIQGLPALIFFDRAGRHVLTKSGYLPVPDAVDLLNAAADKIDAGAEPYDPGGLSVWKATPLSRAVAGSELQRLSEAVWFQMDSNLGGFGGPSHDPRPDVMVQLAALAPGDERTERWLRLTVDNALRGESPRLRGEPAQDMDFDAGELRRLSARGARAGPRWRDGVERLPTADPYLGLQDRWDGGIFRYAAGPGWYHPHFERLAADNLSWILVLEALGRREDAAKVRAFVLATFSDGPLLNAGQASDPFYYRLTGEERRGLRTPAVARLWTLLVQARAARVWPARCAEFARVRDDRWPRSAWSRRGEDEKSPDATVDAVGELLLAMAGCPGQEARAAKLAAVVIERWRQGLPANARLHRLAAGVCAAAPSRCGEALATVAGLGLDVEFAPPLVELQTRAR